MFTQFNDILKLLPYKPLYVDNLLDQEAKVG